MRKMKHKSTAGFNVHCRSLFSITVLCITRFVLLGIRNRVLSVSVSTLRILEMSHGRTPSVASSIISFLLCAGKGRPFRNLPPSWFTLPSSGEEPPPPKTSVSDYGGDIRPGGHKYTTWSSVHECTCVDLQHFILFDFNRTILFVTSVKATKEKTLKRRMQNVQLVPG